MMNTYKNTKTGVVVIVDSEVSGDWELVKSEQSLPKKEEKNEETKPVKKETKKKK